jgi:NADP-dependent 3-hydroxy acid dehydrogenase YdfG
MATEINLNERVALVTGASSGIGRETAHALAGAGADVALAARREDQLHELAAELEDIETLVVPTDISDEGAVDAMVEETVDKLGGLDVVIANAGVGAPGEPVAETSTKTHRKIVETNIDGTFFTARASLPHLLESEGNLIFMSSIAGQYPRPATPMYAASKWWIRGFALSVEAQVGSEGVGVTIVNPAEVRTDIEVLGKPVKEHFDQGEVVEPKEVAEAVVFAASQENATISELDVYWRGKLGQF